MIRKLTCPVLTALIRNSSSCHSRFFCRVSWLLFKEVMRKKRKLLSHSQCHLSFKLGLQLTIIFIINQSDDYLLRFITHCSKIGIIQWSVKWWKGIISTPGNQTITIKWGQILLHLCIFKCVLTLKDNILRCSLKLLKQCQIFSTQYDFFFLFSAH